MSKWHLVIDVSRCENCNNCVLAAKDELVGNDFPGYSAPHAAQGRGVIRIERHVRGRGHHVDAVHVPVMCNHCDRAPCLKAGADGAVRKRDDGIVIFDPVKAKGRRDLVDACPYGAVVWNEREQLPQTWFFDAHLLDAGWNAPRCVAVCPTQAIEAVRTDDATMAARIEREGLRPLRPELGTGARVLYRHLDRAFSRFIGGSVVYRDAEGRIECAEGVEIELHRDGGVLARTRTDAFGDFRIDGLAQNSGPYLLSARHAHGGTAERPVHVRNDSVVLEDIELRPAGQGCPA